MPKTLSGWIWRYLQPPIAGKLHLCAHRNVKDVRGSQCSCGTRAPAIVFVSGSAFPLPAPKFRPLPISLNANGACLSMDYLVGTKHTHGSPKRARHETHVEAVTRTCLPTELASKPECIVHNETPEGDVDVFVSVTSLHSSVDDQTSEFSRRVHGRGIPLRSRPRLQPASLLVRRLSCDFQGFPQAPAPSPRRAYIRGSHRTVMT